MNIFVISGRQYWVLCSSEALLNNYVLYLLHFVSLNAVSSGKE
jgi:hypothetical protein